MAVGRVVNYLILWLLASTISVWALQASVPLGIAAAIVAGAMLGWHAWRGWRDEAGGAEPPERGRLASRPYTAGLFGARSQPDRASPSQRGRFSAALPGAQTCSTNSEAPSGPSSPHTPRVEGLRRLGMPVLFLAAAPLFLRLCPATPMVAALLALAALTLFRRYLNWRPTPLDLPMLALLICVMSSALLVGSYSDVAGPRLWWLAYGMALVQLAGRMSSPSLRRLVNPSIALALAALLVVALGATGWEDGKWFSGQVLYGAIARAQLLRRIVTVQPNEAAGALVLLAPLAAAVALGSRGPVRWLVGTEVAAAIGYDLLAQSRHGLAALLFALWVVLLLNRRRWAIALAAAGAAAMGLLAALSQPLARATVAVTNADGFNDLASRFDIWRQALPMVRDFAVTGSGPGTFPAIFSRYYSLEGPDSWFAIMGHVHNQFLDVSLALGVPGLVAFVAIITAFSLAMLFQRDSDGQARLLRQASAGAVLGFCLVFGAGDAISIGAKGGIVLWATLAAGLAITRPKILGKS